jgi:hypothetical protein
MNIQPNLSSQQWRILEFLAQATDWCTRQDMYAFVGTEKGYSRALGAPTGRHQTGKRDITDIDRHEKRNSLASHPSLAEAMARMSRTSTSAGSLQTLAAAPDFVDAW